MFDGRSAWERLLAAALLVLVICVFWKPLLWIVLILIVFLLVWLGVILFRADRIKREMEKDPDAYFAGTAEPGHPEGQVIDADYTEKVIKEEKEKTNVK